ncbi:N-substituted formamide deformylase precursor [Thalassovita gelatinovora]|uniref:N-substituted formamide deformylase n=1 Tax=Thalassovita gelatinovora TaxID=53501 RepID=A0A0P1FRA6_THAGE|nr:amidohydrolase [Thalassovita gelatinovora]QIZ81299.1 amidohydrolase [Thalassovita gelatinovora]CUH64545.1 N-substituted formamide deformylase precursor [Thalassovita gelatinovora]SEP96458.1 hypothetical protein SAMN04488043_102330 [Thalassovita gelatinovora]
MTKHADLIIKNATVYSGTQDAPNASWVALRGCDIMAIGTGPVDHMVGQTTRVVDAQDQTVLPGLNDAHLHLFAGGLGLTELSLRGVRGRSGLQAAIDSHRAANPELVFLAAHSCAYEILETGEQLERTVLDELCPDLPVLIMSEDFHTSWCNSKAIALAGIERGAELPHGSSVKVDEAGEATGVLLELNAIELVRGKNPRSARHAEASQRPLEVGQYTKEERQTDKEVLWAALIHCAEQGLTAVQNMDGSLYQLELLAELDQDRGLPVRVRMPFQISKGMRKEDLAHAVHWRRRFNSEMLRCDFIKIFADGVIESGTANLLAEYCNIPGQSGHPIYEDQELNSLIQEADRLGFQIAVHCVGDGAVHQVLNAFDGAQKANGWREARHRIEHIEMIDAADIARFPKLGVVASMQPTHVPEAGEGYLEFLGPSRGDLAFPMRQLCAVNAAYVLSTDWPVAPLSPLITLEAAMTRTEWPGAGIDHRLGWAEALAGITYNAAWVAFEETLRGRIAPGLRGDLTIVSGNPADLFKGETSEVLLAICNGRVTYDSFGGDAQLRAVQNEQT